MQAKTDQLGIVSVCATPSGTFLRGIQAVNLTNQFDYTPHRIQFVFANLLIDVALVAMRAVERVSRKAALVDDLHGRIDGPDLHRRDV